MSKHKFMSDLLEAFGGCAHLSNWLDGQVILKCHQCLHTRTGEQKVPISFGKRITRDGNAIRAFEDRVALEPKRTKKQGTKEKKHQTLVLVAPQFLMGVFCLVSFEKSQPAHVQPTTKKKTPDNLSTRLCMCSYVYFNQNKMI